MASQRITVLGSISSKLFTPEDLRTCHSRINGLPIVFYASWLDSWSVWGVLFHLLGINPPKDESKVFVILAGKKLLSVRRRFATLLKHHEGGHGFETRMFLKTIYTAANLSLLRQIRVYILIEILGPSVHDDDILRFQQKGGKQLIKAKRKYRRARPINHDRSRSISP